MWRESLRIGVESVDTQHQALFSKTEELLKEIKAYGVAHKDKCVDTVLFLKEYAVKHFAEEEAYQQSIGYAGFAAHKKLHEKFVDTVLYHERKMVASDFAEKDVKAFSGMLVTWLLYHIAEADQQIGKAAAAAPETPHNHGEILLQSVCHVLEMMAGFDGARMRKINNPQENLEGMGDMLTIEVELTGDIAGYITLLYSPAFINNFIFALMNFTPEDFDELVISALFEATNIICGTACGKIAKEKGVCCDIKPPLMTKRSTAQPDERIVVDTDHGFLEADIAISYRI